ncbi:MAG: hypothetical protein ACTJG9_08735 [Alcaligenes aquatilis]
MSHSNVNCQSLREWGSSNFQGQLRARSLLLVIKHLTQGVKGKAAAYEALECIADLAEVGAENVAVQADKGADLLDLIDALDKPVVDMTLSVLQSNSIRDALHALRQVIPDDQEDVIGAVNVVIRLADSLAMHLITGGEHKLLKEALFEADGDTKGGE